MNTELSIEAQSLEPAPLRAERYQTWIDAWSMGSRDLTAARLLLTRCAGSMTWLKTDLCDPLASALAGAYDMFPELWIDLPLHALADKIAAEPAGGYEQALSNQLVARRLDPGSARTMAVLMAGVEIVDPECYARDLEAWLASSPPQAQVTRLLRCFADTDLSAAMLDYVGKLAGYGEGRRSISGDIVAEFSSVMASQTGGDGVPLPGGEAFVRARKAIDAASNLLRREGRETPASLSATVRRLRAGLAAGGYDADNPPLQLPGRVIEDPSWIGGWAEYLADGRAFLRAKYLGIGKAKPSPADGSVTAEGPPPYQLTTGPGICLLAGHYRLRFIGQVETPSLIHFEARAFTGKKGEHTMASVTRQIGPTSSEGELAALEFVLDEVAINAKYQTDVLVADGSVTLAGVEIVRKKV